MATNIGAHIDAGKCVSYFFLLPGYCSFLPSTSSQVSEIFRVFVTDFPTHRRLGPSYIHLHIFGPPSCCFADMAASSAFFAQNGRRSRSSIDQEQSATTPLASALEYGLLIIGTDRGLDWIG
jgi:hypothetical protein